MRSGLFLLVVACVVLVGSIGVGEESKYPYVGKVNASRVNVRAGKGTNYRILQVAKKDDLIVVIAAKGEWLKIRCPDGSKVWVHSRFMKVDGDVAVAMSSKINVRATDSARDALVAQLEEGDVVQVIRKKGDWLQIKSPDNAVAWIFGKYVEYVDEEGEYVKNMRNKETVVKMLEELDGMLAEEKAERSPEEWNIRPLLRGYKELKELVELADLGEVSTRIAARAAERIGELERIAALQTDLVSAKGVLKDIRAKYEKQRKELDDPVESYTAKGWVEDLGKIWRRPGTHRLKMGGETQYILKSTRHDLYDYVGFLVGVNGTVREVRGWKPVIEVEQIDVLHAESSEF